MGKKRQGKPRRQRSPVIPPQKEVPEKEVPEKEVPVKDVPKKKAPQADEDKKTVVTVKSQAGEHRVKILDLTCKVAACEDELAALWIEQEATLLELENKKNDAHHEKLKLQEELADMERNHPDYKKLRLAFFDVQTAEAKLTTEVKHLKTNQANMRKRREAEIGLIKEKITLEKAEMEESQHDAKSKRERALSIASLKSAEKMKEVAKWAEGCAKHAGAEPESEEKADSCVQEVEKFLEAPVDDKAAKGYPQAVPTVIQQYQIMPDPTLRKILSRQSVAKDLPHFAGEPEKWPRFKKEFKRISEECGYSDSENMARLEKCLKGQALNAVESLLDSPENVNEVMERLELLFGHSSLVINAMLDKVRKIPPMKDGNMLGLIDIGIAASNLTAKLKSMDNQRHLQNPCIVKELEDKLTGDYRVKWFDWIKADKERTDDLVCFSRWILDQTDTIRRAYSPSRADKNSDKLKNSKIERCNAVAAQATTTKKRTSCNVCGKEGHWANQCRMFQSKTVEERRKIVCDKKLCMSCLIPGHRMNDCRKKKVCGEGGCQECHNPLLHKVSAPRQNVPAPQQERIEVSNTIQEDNNAVTHGVGRALMGAIPVLLQGPCGTRECLAFLDTGSSVTLLEDSLAKELGIEGEKEPFCMSTMTSKQRFADSRNVSLTIKGTWSTAKSYNMTGVRTVDSISLGKMTQDAEKIKKTWPHLENVPIPSFTELKPRLLIGNLHCFLTGTRQTVGTFEDKPIAFKCRLGWSVGGPQFSLSRDKEETCFHICENVCSDSDELLHQMVKKSSSTEDFGVKVNHEKPRSREDARALEVMKATTVRVEGEDRYETGLLWKNPETTLPESRSLAYNRLMCQEKKMDKDPVFAKTYCNKMEEYEKKGFIRKLKPEEIWTDSERLWYLSHFSVWNPNKPDKIRLVFNAAAKSHGVSLNSSLSMGPDLNNPLTSVLWNFRRHKHAVIGDIKDMFHRVYMRKEDRVSQRFLWRGMDRNSPPAEYEMVVMVFGATCSPSSAQFVKNLNAEEFKKQFPEASNAIQRYFYVDDLLFSCPEEDEMKKIVAEVIEINKKGGFIVCNWLSNSKEVNESIPEELRSPSLNEVDMDSQDLPTGRVLGLWWLPTSDEFTFKLLMHKVARDIIDKKRRPTKREILQVAMSLYDPLGFLGHLSVKVKILLQDIWRSEIGWDDALSNELIIKWNDWMDEVHGVIHIRIPRCYSEFLWKSEDTTLQVFCDASEKAFAAVVFLRVKYEDDIKVSIVSSKTRVAPLEPLSIPRLELQAAVLGSRLAKKIQDEMDVKLHGITYWTDSMTVLRWIRSDARTFKPFISHRLGEILETTDVHQWRYVPTEMNVADDATRNNSPSDLTNESRWFNGPKFLYEDPSTWPQEKDSRIEVIEDDLEMKIMQVNAISVESPGWIEKFSKFSRLVRVTAYVLGFFKRLRKRIRSRCRLLGIGLRFAAKSRLLSVKEIRRAEMRIVKCAQRDSFEEEVECLNGGKEVSKRSRLRKLEPFASEDGIVRVGGRLRRCHEDMEFRNPAILDRKHHVTRLLIQCYHERCGHQGFRTVANELRQKYWILDGVSAVKQAFRDCEACKRRKVKPVTPKMSEIPVCRLESKIRPFTNTGMDYFGPMTVQVGRRHEKRWGAIFTCLSTRAVHLEIAASLSTDSCIMAIQRFASRRGVPAHVYSDNGTNFKGADNELKALLKELKSEEIEEKISGLGIQWHFNPPGAPHMGGAWERLVGSVKRTMEGILRDVHPKEELLYTVMCEAEFILNSRPLTEVSVDPNDAVSLTPNHFLLGWTGGSSSADLKQPIWGQMKDFELYLKKQWRFSQHLANQFWIRWRKEYLPTLTMRSKWIRNQRNVKEGDVVILVEDNAPRNKWPLGKVSHLYPGKDGIVRVVDVKTSTGEYRRPVSKICILQPAEDEVPSSGGSNVD